MGPCILISFNMIKFLSLYIYEAIYFFFVFYIILSFKEILDIALWITDNTR